MRDGHADAPSTYLTTMTESTPTTLRAEQSTDGWSVIDTDGGRWWPGDEAAAEIEASDDPAVAAVRICDESPMRGRWAD